MVFQKGFDVFSLKQLLLMSVRAACIQFFIFIFRISVRDASGVEHGPLDIGAKHLRIVFDSMRCIQPTLVWYVYDK